MRYVNNWLAQTTAGIGPADTALPLSTTAISRLPAGEYLLTLVNSASPVAQTDWEVVRVTVADGTATAVRGQEGSAPQVWPAGTLIYCSLTAGFINGLVGQLASLTARVVALEEGGGVVPEPDGALLDQNGNTLVDDQGNTLIGV